MDCKNICILVCIIINIIFSGCSNEPENLTIGRDQCYFCKMTFSDTRFGGVVFTKKGRSIKFDDIACLRSFLKSNFMEKSDIRDIYLLDYTGTHQLINLNNAYLLNSNSLNTPMEGSWAAFSNKDSLATYAKQFNGTLITWEQLMK